MKTNDFAKLHPVILFTYFTAVILFSMFFMHPVFLAISFFCGFLWAVSLAPRETLRFTLKCILPLAVLMTVINPMINHAGLTVLLYVNDRPITLEACAYGAASAAMFSSVLLWFSCSNRIMTAEKFISLFGRAAPSFSLLLSMVMRFVPRFKAQTRAIAEAQDGLGRGVDSGSLPTRAKNGMKILSILTTWALENGVITADSMRARGYGLPGRGRFQIYRFDSRDKWMLTILSALIFAVLFGFIKGENSIRYFPFLSLPPFSPFSFFLFICYFLLCSYPMLFNAVCEVKYHGGF